MDISNISVSRRDVWKECIQKYKYQYHLKLSPEEPEPFYFTYGSIIHRIAEEYVSNKKSISLQQITESFINGKMSIGTDREGNENYVTKIPPEYLKRMPEHLRAIERITEQVGVEGWTEYEFEYDLDPPHNRLLKGVIDRLICKNGKYWIIDYKTSKKGVWRKKTVTNDLQLRCYARVVQKQFNANASDIQAALYYLEGSELVAAKYSNQSLLDAEKELLEIYKQIEQMPPEEAWGNVGSHCSRCQFRTICTFYKIT